jgi:hypothetical protein
MDVDGRGDQYNSRNTENRCVDKILKRKFDSRGNIEIRDVNGDTAYLSNEKFFDPVTDAKNKELR